MNRVNFISLHSQFFQDYGFTWNDDFMIFQKSFPTGQQVIFVHYHENPTESTIEYSLGIRIHRVEELIHKFLPTLSGFSERSITLIQTLDKIGKEIPKRFEIHNDWEIAQVIMAAEKALVSDGFPWLDKMINPLNLELAFYERKAKSFKTHNFIYNAFRATALSKLYNPSDYQFLRQLFLEHIEEKQMTPFMIASFLKFLDYLDKLD